MKRRVIQQGGKTLMVSLPIKWAEKYNVDKGDELEIEDNGSKICFRAAETESLSDSVSLSLEGLNERAVRYILSSLHKKGYDELRIEFANPLNLKVIEELVRRLYVGFAIVEQSEKIVVVRCISKELASEFDAALRRAFLVTLSMGDSIIEALRKGEPIAPFEGLESTNNQLTNFCERLLNKNPYLAAKNQSFLYVIAWNLEKVCDDYKYICRLELSGLGQGSLELFEMVQRLLRGYYELFYRFELRAISELADLKKHVQVEGFALLETTRADERRLVFFLLSACYKIVEFSASITAVKHKL
jgi:phosphate uptake regulator